MPQGLGGAVIVGASEERAQRGRSKQAVRLLNASVPCCALLCCAACGAARGVAHRWSTIFGLRRLRSGSLGVLRKALFRTARSLRWKRQPWQVCAWQQ